MSSSLEELKQNFSLFDDWEERYRYLIDLGRKIPRMDEVHKTDENLVRGCTSKVWLVATMNNTKLHFIADSDAHIVRGLIALLDVAYQGKEAVDIQNIDIEKVFREIGLEQHLSPNRRSGFYAMVERIKDLAKDKSKKI